jgi:mycothiol synthase
MVQVEVARTLSDDDRRVVEELIEVNRRATGEHPLSDQFRLELEQGSDGFTALLAWYGGHLAAYAQLGRSAHQALTIALADNIESAVAEQVVQGLIDAACRVVADDGGGELHWWIADPRAHLHECLLCEAAAAGFRLDRTLLQMRVDLPIDQHDRASVSTRPFVEGADESAWLEVNNRAFAGHHEQGGWTLESLRRRQREPWFDPEGFLLHEREGRLAAFCWTKIHLETTPVLGEIYVVAVHPDFHGLGLGRSLTVAGLDHISEQGVGVGMLYVDEANAAAVSLYRSLGFEVHRSDHALVAHIQASAHRQTGATT